jgi:NNMT/PNMT/TEMT family
MAPRRLWRKSPLVAGDGTQPAALISSPSRQAFTGLNSDFPWDEFDSSWYYDHNYKVLRDDDRRIVEIVRDFFATFGLSSHSNGIDVGSGTNLYPALAMLPLCDKITLYEYSTSNVEWLQRETRSYSSSWDAFWELLAIAPLYKSVDSPRETLAAVARVERGSIFDLPESCWDIGTMFFTAESISSTPSEFRAALESFIRSLRTGSPFAAALMENSVGCSVGTRRFPAVAITANDVKVCLAGDTEDLKVHRIGLTNKPLRAGYDGMILATGRVV